tara:strand:- start:80 stop:238 length:159 start_codon:yes stop_codon:yes gene_type:complete
MKRERAKEMAVFQNLNIVTITPLYYYTWRLMATFSWAHGRLNMASVVSKVNT